jgi:hypothetical protein
MVEGALPRRLTILRSESPATRPRESSSRSSSDRRNAEGDVDQIGPCFAMLEPAGDHTKRECLDLGLGLGRGGAIRQDTRKLRNFRYPSPVILTLKLNLEPQAKPPRAGLLQAAPRIHRHAWPTLELSCEAPIRLASSASMMGWTPPTTQSASMCQSRCCVGKKEEPIHAERYAHSRRPGKGCF